MEVNMLKLFRQRGRNFLDKMRIGFLLLLLSVVEVPSVVPSSRVSVEAPSHQAFLFSPFCLLNFLGCEMELKKGEDIRFC